MFSLHDKLFKRLNTLISMNLSVFNIIYKTLIEVQ